MKARGVWERIELALFRVLLFAYGPGFRRRYRAEFLFFFDRDRQLQRHAGFLGALRFWGYTLSDLSAAAWRDRVVAGAPARASLLRDCALDVRVSLRGLVRSPGFAITVVAILAVGLTAATLIFAIASAALVEPLPFPDHDRLVMVLGTLLSDRDQVRGASYLEVQDWARRTSSFTDLAAVAQVPANLVAESETERLVAEIVDPRYFRILGGNPMLGRVLTDEDNRAPDAAPVVVISEGLWERRFGADAAAVGATLTVNERDLVIVGIMPKSFRGVSLRAELWIPTMMASTVGRGGTLESRRQRWMRAVGRLRPGLDTRAAQGDLDAVAASLADEFPEIHHDRTGSVRRLRPLYLGPARDVLVVMMASAALLLVVAAANVAGLLSVRATGKGSELALRTALGASRVRLIRQLLTESLVYAILGGVTALTISMLALPAVLAALPVGALPAHVRPEIDLRTFTFALVALLGASLVAGFVPAARSSRTDLSAALRATRSALPASISRWSPQQLLVVGEVCVAVVLLVGTGLMVRTFAAKLAVPPGFDGERPSAFRLQLPTSRYEGAAVRAFTASLQQALEALPEIEQVTYGSGVPLRPGGGAGFLALQPNSDERIRYFRHQVAPGYLELLGIRLLGGRGFTDGDDDNAPDVAIVSRELAVRLYGAVTAAGEAFWLVDGTEVRIVGVVDTVRWRDLTSDLDAGDSNPDVYFPFQQSATASLEVVLRPRPGQSVQLGRVREVVARLDAALPVVELTPLRALLAQQTAPDKMAAGVLALFAASAVLLAGTGVYGVLAYSVSCRVREIAIRRALGASARRLQLEIISYGLALVVLGAALGSVAAVAVSRYLAALLFGVSPQDPVTFVAVIALIGTVALLATTIPALKATRIQAQQALKTD